MGRETKEIKSKDGGSHERISKMASKETVKEGKHSRGSVTSNTTDDPNGVNPTNKRRSTGSVTSLFAKQVPIPVKPSKAKSFVIDELPPCQIYRTRRSLDNIDNPIDFPRDPMKYHPPFRRNFRYFGYPQDLNLNINTPPRVRSWGPIEDSVLKSAKHKRRGPKTKYNFRVDKTKGFDPYWMGRLLKRNLLLNNPGLLPPIDKAAISLGSEDKVKLLHPDFHVQNCVSDLYFPLTDKSRKAFCKINKTIHDKIEQQVHTYTVENPWLTKDMALEQVLMRNEEERKSLLTQKQSSANEQERRSTLQQWRSEKFTLEEVLSTSEERLVYYYETKGVSPVVKTLCVNRNYPGLNRQVYGRPVETDEVSRIRRNQSEFKLRYGGIQLPNFPMNISEDVWQKLSKVRQRQMQLEKNMQARLLLNNPDLEKFRTFTQLEMRNEVMTAAREEFMRKLKEDLHTPLPPELFQDNRDQLEPYHDFSEKGEFPPQGPFSWRVKAEELPTEEELDIVEKYIIDAKKHHSFTHHLPGQQHHPRHPYPSVELDWIEKGMEEGVVREVGKTPSELYEMPAYVMHLDRTRFKEKFDEVVKEGAKELVGPEMWNLYKKTYGIVEEVPKGPVEDTPVVVEKKMRRKKKKTPSIHTVSNLQMVNEEEEAVVGVDDTNITEEEEVDKEEEEEDGEGVDLNVEPDSDLVTYADLEMDSQLSAELLAEEPFPLPSLRFSSIDFPMQEITPSLRDDFKLFKHNIEASEPVKKDDEEPKGEDDADSDSNTEDTSSSKKLIPTVSHDPVSHLQVMYQEAVKSRQRSFHRPVKDKDMEPPKLKDIFLRETYVEDIENLLNQNENMPKFLQLF